MPANKDFKWEKPAEDCGGPRKKEERRKKFPGVRRMLPGLGRNSRNRRIVTRGTFYVERITNFYKLRHSSRVERLFHRQQVAGSNPAVGTFGKYSECLWHECSVFRELTTAY